MLFRSKDFEVRLDNVNSDIDMVFMSLIGEPKTSRADVLMDIIKQPMRQGSRSLGLAKDFIDETKQLVTHYITALKNLENYNREAAYFIDKFIKKIKEQKEIIDGLQKDLKLTKGDDWEGEYKKTVRNKIKEWLNEPDIIGARVGHLKRNVVEDITLDTIKKKKMKLLIDEEFDKIKEQTQSKTQIKQEDNIESKDKEEIGKEYSD